MIHEDRQNVLQFLSDLGHGSVSLRGPIPRSAGYISVGDVLTFHYNPNRTGTGETPHPLVLVVATKKGRGIIISPRGNKLVTGFIINNISSNTAAIFLKKLYGNSSISYDMLNTLLGRFLGGEYRTWDLRYLNELEEVLIDVNKLVTDE